MGNLIQTETVLLGAEVLPGEEHSRTIETTRHMYKMIPTPMPRSTAGKLYSPAFPETRRRFDTLLSCNYT